MAHTKSKNPNEFILPDLGEGVHEAELIKWRVSVGDSVAEHDILAEMETDKALVEVPSPRAGVIKALHGSEGEILNVGNVLVEYEGDGNGAVATDSTPQPKAEAPASSAEEAPEEREDAGTVVGQMSDALGGVTATPGKALATPAVRRLARDLGVDINSIGGSGIGGRVLEKDVRAASGGGGAATKPAPTARSQPAAVPSMATPQPVATPAPQPSTPSTSIPQGSAELRTPFRGVRRTIADRLRESVNQAVHFNVMDEADVTELDSLRKRLAAASGEKVSFLPFVASALCRVLTDDRFRVLNSRVEESGDSAEIVTHRAVHMGIATDTGSGLMVPVVRDCDAYGVLQIGRMVTQVATGARSRTIAREDLMGSTFTISNVGSHAGRFATPIINYPEVGILAVGRAKEAPVVQNGWFRVGKLLPLSLACDHRVVDGATAALALAEVVKLLQSPEGLLEPARR